ncbi:hypothetical protein LOK49_LG12G02478 [Camellia lanceoleosa]|uniref:Uncharacterized protein n=1 Tax=Camellia lanceoleosa TaxID=1840588 RepID=A0ACC0FW35_9ERIC|nr:hypothetical protein LOK49_LG12G02478 [Camellia lanceoleosa]
MPPVSLQLFIQGCSTSFEILRGVNCLLALLQISLSFVEEIEELIRNLIGTGYMSTDQKKKLLWGNKKSTTTEEFGHHWDMALFSDRERQEKFNKLMGVKGELKVEHKPDNQEGSGLQAEKQEELQLDLEKQYTARLRRKDGRTVGLGH